MFGRLKDLIRATLLLTVLVAQSVSAQTQPLRIFHVMSFDSPWRWTDGQFAGFKEGLGVVDAEYKVFQMDIKRYTSSEDKAERGRLARDIIDTWKPDLVYLSDDAAIEHVAAHYGTSPLPFVFSGANKTLEEHALSGRSNLTGVLEREHFVESIRLLRNMVPGVKRIAVISDPAPHFKPVIDRIHAGMAKLEGVELVRVDVLERYSEFQARVKAYEQEADAVVYLGIFNFKDDQGQPVPYEVVQRWVVENSRLPEVSFWIDRIHFGVLGSVTVSEREQGIAAGKLARAILVDGVKPAALPVEPTVKGRPAINLARARGLGITVQSSELLSAEVVTDFQWTRTPK
jgi:ABC-type uncharacterized transport system substrate-binding protein